MAQSKEKKKEIDGITFQVAPFMAMEGLRLKAHLVKTFGPALGELLGGLNIPKAGSIGDLNLGSTAVTSGIEKLMGNLSENAVETLTKRLLVNTIATWDEGGKSRSVAFIMDFDTAFDLVFSQRLFTLYPLILFILEVNYPDFFKKVVSGIGRKTRATLTSEADEQTSSEESEKSETLES
jgi:hypothetical protein